MKKAEHAKYLAQLDDLLTGAFGAVKEIDFPATDTTPARYCYTVATVYGPLKLMPAMPYARHYEPDVFGRFLTVGIPYPADANPYSGKWNTHFADDTDADTALEHIRAKLSRVMPKVTA